MNDEPAPLEDRREGLLTNKFGWLVNWRVPEVVQTIGPFDRTAFDDFEGKRVLLIENVRAKLLEYSDQQIEILSSHSLADPEKLKDSWRKLFSSEIDRLRGDVPPWYAGGFGHPDRVADFDYWAKMPSFTVEEMTCLSVGIAPKDLPMEVRDNLRPDRINSLKAAAHFLALRYKLLSRTFDPQDYKTSIKPKSFLTWAEQVDFAVHPEFLFLLQKYHAEQSADSAQNGAHSNSKAAPDKREIDKIAQLFTALAIDFLGYVPKQARSPIPKEITEIAGGMGLEVSTDTVLKYLRHGASFIPEGWEPKTR